jgi:ATP/maltotriose-dependent transcriptional regulator MalT
MEAGALLVLAALRAKTGDPSGAERELEEALRTMPQRGLPWRVYALALVAELCLERGDVAAALVRARPAIEAVETAGVEAEIFVRMIWVRTLEASGEPERARAELTTAVAKLHRWASYIRSEEDRRTFLEIDEHRRTLDLARAWGLPVQRG